MKKMLDLGIEERMIFVDKQSGKDFNRPSYQTMKRNLRKGDLLYLDALDRLGRDYEGIIHEWKYITRNIQANIVVLENETLFDSRKYKRDGRYRKVNGRSVSKPSLLCGRTRTKENQTAPSRRYSARQISRLPKLSISNESIKYYASLVSYYSVYNLKRLNVWIVYVYLLCFVSHRYQRMHDNLINTLIYSVRGYSDEAKLAAKERVYEVLYRE